MLVKCGIDICIKVPKIAPELLFPISGMNCSDKMLIFLFFCINQINLLQICNQVFCKYSKDLNSIILFEFFDYSS